MRLRTYEEALALLQAGDMKAMEFQLQQANLSVPGVNASASPAAAVAAASPAVHAAPAAMAAPQVHSPALRIRC
jgi:hypothetical protein